MFNCKTKSDVLKAVKEYDISFIQFWFTDVLGRLKSFQITPSELDEGIDEGMGFDGSSIEGFARIHESDMIAKPDLTTFQMLPWRPLLRSARAHHTKPGRVAGGRCAAGRSHRPGAGHPS